MSVGNNPSQIELYYGIPNRRVQSFVGREDILTRLDEAFSTSGRKPHIAVIKAIGGQGKTQIALEYCHRTKNKLYSAIFWIDATSERSVIGSFQSVSEHLKTSTDHFPDPNARIAFVLQFFAARSMVFDNYDDPEAFSIRDFIPEGEFGAIIVTSRHADTSALVDEHGPAFIELPGLGKSAALELLTGPGKIGEHDLEHTEDIVERFEYHPLAIAQARSYIEKR